MGAVYRQTEKMFVTKYLVGLALTSAVQGLEEEITCGNGEVIDLSEVDEFHWYSPGWIDGDKYPENSDCKVTFSVPPKHNFRIDSIYDFDVHGDYNIGCEGGDYVQFIVDGKKAEKFCGWGEELSDEWCWEDWCYPNTFEVIGNADRPTMVEAIFKSGKSVEWVTGFDIAVSSGWEWDSEEPEMNYDGIPMLPMLM